MHAKLKHCIKQDDTLQKEHYAEAQVNLNDLIISKNTKKLFSTCVEVMEHDAQAVNRGQYDRLVIGPFEDCCQDSMHQSAAICHSLLGWTAATIMQIIMCASLDGQVGIGHAKSELK